ncbi:MAG TPA: farnesyl diphosphate synthase [Gemmataceae bacterium]|nr:farnesyl diphosphate synthase [Gemmataceae bacterium]
MSSLDDYLREKRALVDVYLEEALHPRDGCPARLLEAMRYSLLAPGKRLRPLLAILACEACGGRDRDALPAGAAVEMVHAYSLIHDDLPAMDDDDLRRGRATCHKRFDEATAILAGDALLTMAFEVLGHGYLADTAIECVRVLAREAGLAGMVGGQADDLAWETEDGPRRLEELESLHVRKTGALIRASLRLGVLAAGEAALKVPVPSSLHLQILFDEYGRRLGLAFQITDDLLDVEGTADDVGKRVQKDAGRGKLTYPGLLGVAESRRRAERLCREACEVLSPLGPAAHRLAELARYVVERDR